MLTAEELCALNRLYVTLPRDVRKTIFRLRVWQTAENTSRGNSGELWKTLQDVLGETNGEICDAHTADDFATFFQNKVDSVRSSTASSSLYDVPCRDQWTSTCDGWGSRQDDRLITEQVVSARSSSSVIPLSAVVSRQRLRSAQHNTLVVPRYRLTTYGRRAFSIAGATALNGLPVAFRDPILVISDACFRRHLKTVLFAQQCQYHSV